MLSANTYEPYGGNLKKTEFANGQYVQYTYDEFDRKTQAEYNNGRYIRYFYNAEGSVSKLTYGDGTTEKGSYQFEYDSLGRLIRSTEYRAGGLFQRTEHLYDALKRLKNASVVNSSNVELFKTACSYRTVSGNQSSAQVEYYNVKHGSSFYVKIDRTIDYI